MKIDALGDKKNKLEHLRPARARRSSAHLARADENYSLSIENLFIQSFSHSFDLFGTEDVDRHIFFQSFEAIHFWAEEEDGEKDEVEEEETEEEAEQEGE